MYHRFMIGFAACALALIGIVGSAMGQEAARTDQPETMRAEPETHGDQMTKQDMLFKSSQLSDLQVFNDQNQDLGSLNNLIIDAQSGQVLYGVLSTGFFTGKTIAVPWSAFRFDKRDGEHVLLLSKTKDQLTGAPEFDENNMGSLLTSDKWTKTVNDFFGVRTAARPVQSDHHQH